MCGIVGALCLKDRAPVDPQAIEDMVESIRHRGPDSGGVYIEPGVALGARRLAVIDVEGGSQPVANEDESVWAVQNGEIYNFAALRAELETLGHRFRTRCDTEVLVHAYEEWGEDLPMHLHGMFAFAVWDGRRRRLLLGRDRAGIKPLFFSVVGGWLLFASEIKALLRHPLVSARMRPAAVNHYLALHYVPDPLTIFEGIESLPPAHQLAVEYGVPRVSAYWRLAYRVDRRMSLDDAAAGLRQYLEEAVRSQLVADVPLGVLLSGGVDSSAITALMAKHATGPVESFTIGYADGGAAFDERVYAREVARRYATNHHEFEMEPDLDGLLPELVRAFDQPFGNATAIPSWHLAKLTRQHVTVALSGLGGDEIAAGYERHRGALLAERIRWLPRWWIRRVLAPVASAIPDPRSGSPWVDRAKRFTRAAALPFDDRYFDFLSRCARRERAALLAPEFLEQVELDEPRHHFHATLARVRHADPLHRALYADLQLYLPGDLLPLTDRVSMAHALETRVPFLDHRLLEFAASIPPEHKVRGVELKHVLKRAVADLLPEAFFQRRKMGFSAPVPVWLRGPLRERVEEALSPDAIRQIGIFRPEAVRRLLDEHFARRRNHDDRIFALLCFATWHREYMGRGAR